jgi:MFS family permease
MPSDGISHSERVDATGGLPAGRAWWRSLTRAQWLVLLAAGLAWVFDCFDQQIFNLARDGAMEDLLVDKTKATVFGPYTTSVFLVGWAVGGLIFGPLADRFGRARMLKMTILLYSVSTGLNSLSTGFFDFCLWRLLTGIGIGGVFGVAVALVADSLPDRARPAALGLMQAFGAFGNIAAALTGMALGGLSARHALPFHLRQWQALFLVGALPALLCLLAMRKVAEPAKWVDAREEGSRRGVKFGSYRSLLGDPRWRRNAWLGLVVCSAGIIGLWGVGNFHPKIVGSIVDQELAARHLSPEAMASQRGFWRSAGLLLQNIGAFFGLLLFTKLTQLIGRRIALGLGLLLSFLSTVLVFKFMRHTGQIYWMLPTMGFGQLAVFGVYAIYLPELFPTSLRSTGVSFCYNIGRIVAATAPFTVSQITARLGGDIESFRSAGLWVSLVLLTGIVVLPMMPETKGRQLPEE